MEEEEKLAMKEKVSDAELLNFDLLRKKNFGEADDEEQLSNRWVLSVQSEACKIKLIMAAIYGFP